MFVLTALLYPCVLAVLSLGAGLLADRLSGSFLPAPLLLPVGVATLIGVSQLTTFPSFLAPATPVLLALVAALGFAVSWPRLRLLAGVLRARWVMPFVSVLVFLIALAPVLAAGRATFSSFMTLSDSAVHMIGADYLIHHGQSYAHLDLGNSYGQYIENYYGHGYPSGADTLFGGTAVLLGLPLIWAFQPFNAFILATAAGPAWLLLRRIGLPRGWAAVGTVCATLPALVYAYELFGSVKEITALPMLLTLVALAVRQRAWLGLEPARALPFGLAFAAGLSALGVAFAAWGLTAAIVVLAAAVAQARRGAVRTGSLLASAGVVLVSVLVAAWPTWSNLSKSIGVAEAIASTSNPGNLRTPLRAIQVAGVWLHGSYKLPPGGGALLATHLLIALTVLGGLLGALHLLRIRAYALLGWIALMLLAWLAVSQLVTTWANAKTLMLTSPAVVLLAWAGVAGLWQARTSRPSARVLGGVLAAALAGGVLVSDALQYHVTDLAPTARYEELRRVGARFAGRGPALLTDFDEYALYELRRLDPGGVDFAYPPPAVAAAAGGYGDPVQLDRVAPSALLSYPLIVTRRDPSASPPPSAYRLAWSGAYYDVWQRRGGAPAAIAHLSLAGTPSAQCAVIADLARAPAARGARLVVDRAPRLVRVPLSSASHPRRWGHQRQALVMSTPGRLSARFVVPSAGAWQLWVQGEMMPRIGLAVDGRPLASFAGQLSGNSLVPDTLPAVPVRLSAGTHVLSLTRGHFTLAPGEGGSAVLEGIFLAAPGGGQRQLAVVPVSGWRGLCGGTYDWAELVP